MSHQLTFADSEFNGKRRKTRKEIFLARMDALLPWSRMLGLIEPVYPKAGNGCRPYPLDTMLRIHCMQQWYSLSDGAMEDALYGIASMRLFAKLSLDQAIPDRTTIMNFRHLLELHQLARQLFDAVNQWLSEAGIMMKARWSISGYEKLVTWANSFGSLKRAGVEGTGKTSKILLDQGIGVSACHTGI
jgi:IS5 family transposase